MVLTTLKVITYMAIAAAAGAVVGVAGAETIKTVGRSCSRHRTDARPKEETTAPGQAAESPAS